MLSVLIHARLHLRALVERMWSHLLSLCVGLNSFLTPTVHSIVSLIDWL